MKQNSCVRALPYYLEPHLWCNKKLSWKALEIKASSLDWNISWDPGNLGIEGNPLKLSASWVESYNPCWVH